MTYDGYEEKSHQKYVRNIVLLLSTKELKSTCRDRRNLLQEQRLGATAITLTSFALLYPSGSSRSRRLRRMRTRTKNRFRRSWATFEVVVGRVADVDFLALAT